MCALSGTPRRLMTGIVILFYVLVAYTQKGSATMLYTTVASGISHRGSSEELSFANGFLSPIIEVGTRTSRNESWGFFVRFLLDPDNTSHVSSYYLTGKWNYHFTNEWYAGINGGMHIERIYGEKNDTTTTVSSDDAQILGTMALHTGLSLELMMHHYLIIDTFASYSIGESRQWSINAAIGIMSMF